AMQRHYDLNIEVRPVYPLAVRVPDFFEKAHPLWAPYLMRDTYRIAEMHGIPYRWPNPDPIVQDFATRAIAAEQPYIHRLTRLGVAAVEQGRGLPFIAAVSELIWGGVDDWHLGDHLARATAAAGLSLRELDAAIAKDPEHHEAVIQDNQRAHHDAGHWGVPTMVFEGEPFFGQDRLDVLEWRMKQRGLQPREER
ncbi:MAG TPA: DsbA family protein, partial [Terriglobales bacterium]|nr:DsbA family protein [Terriglobales bacterium]